MRLSAQQLADHAQDAFQQACPDDASPYEVGKAWQKVGEHLAALIAEADLEPGCGFIDCVNNPACDPGDPNCPMARAGRASPTELHSASPEGDA